MTSNVTTTRVRCGNRKEHGKDTVYHQSVAEVKECYDNTAFNEDQHEQALAEQAAELRNERWFEERGGAEEDPRERELWAMEDLARETRDIQQREREDDERAYAAKAERDEAMLAASRLDKMTGVHGRDMASPAQIRYALDLLRDRQWPDEITEDDLRNMERRQVSKLIDSLKHSPKLDKPSSNIEAGMYYLGERMIRVYLGQKSGRMLAKEVVGNEDVGYKLQYIGAADRILVGDYRRMTLEEAKAWGKATGHCCVCGRRLDVPESVDAGIGPVCAKKEW